MRCTSPRTVGFLADGKTITWSYKNISKQYATFQLPCSKCLSCRLEYARQWAVRCVHEAQMHEQNIFLTLTYDEQNLKSDKLVYKDFQVFVKKLREHLFQKKLDSMYPTLARETQRQIYRKLSPETKKEIHEKLQISIFVTGEYGDQKKRPHWHACIFNYRPDDSQYHYSNDRGDKIFTSETLTKIWGKGNIEYGNVTFESAGYCARYAAKKLIHGKDEEHDFHPISKKSSKHAIGKKFLEKFWTDIFNTGKIILQDGATCSIPRYYEKWLSKHKPTDYANYVTKLKQDLVSKALERESKIAAEYQKNNLLRTFEEGPLITKQETEKTILDLKFKQLQSNLKL